MNSIPEVKVNYRKGLGKGESGRLRRAGLIPSVVYGLSEAPASISVHPKSIAEVLHSEKGMNSVCNLRVEGSEESRHVMIKSIDRHPVTNRLWHVDFIRVDMDKVVDRQIPIEVTGLPVGVKLGGILNLIHHEVEVVCLAKNLPGTLVLDLTHLGLDQAFRVSDLPAMEGVTYKLDPSEPIAVIHAPQKAEETEAVEGE